MKIFKNLQEITKAVNDICEITESATYQNPQTRLIAENLLALREYSKSISLTFETMDICVAAGSILTQKISEIKNCVENWTKENFSKDSTTLLFQALKDFENILWKMVKLRRTSFRYSIFQLDRKTCC